MSWQTAKIGATCEVKRGTTITEKQAQAGNVPVVAGGLTYSYTHNAANRDGKVITVSGSGANAGYVNFWNQPIFASDCSTIQSISDSVDIQFIFYLLKSKQQFINSTLRSGSAQPHVYAKDIAQMMMPLPPLEDQRRIAAILDIFRLISNESIICTIFLVVQIEARMPIKICINLSLLCQVVLILNLMMVSIKNTSI